MARASYQHIPNIHLGVKRGKTVIKQQTPSKRVFPCFPTPVVAVRPKPAGRTKLTLKI